MFFENVIDIGILLGHFSNQLAVVILGSFFCFLRLRALVFSTYSSAVKSYTRSTVDALCF